MGTVIDLEFPEDRPNVVDLVLTVNGRTYRTAESRGARYAQNPDGSWDLERFVRGAK